MESWGRAGPSVEGGGGAHGHVSRTTGVGTGFVEVTLCLFDVPTVNSLKTGMEKEILFTAVTLTCNRVPGRW